MSEYVYSYDINIFENGYEPVQLCKEIADSPDISVNVSRINTDLTHTSLMIYFEAELTIGEQTALDLIVQSHIPIDRSDYEFDQNIDLLGNRILNLGNPQDDTDGVNKAYVDVSIDETTAILTAHANQVAAQAANQAEQAAIQTANLYTDQTTSSIIQTANDYTDQTTSNIIQTANDYTDQATQLATQSANNYTDQKTTGIIEAVNAYTDQAEQSANAYTDQIEQVVIQSSNAYTDQTALDILEGRRNFNAAQLDITKLSNLPAGGLVGVDARQTLTRKTIDIENGNNIVLNLKNDNIKDGARIDTKKIGDGLVDNTELKRLAGIRSNVQTQIDNVTTRTDAHSSRTDNPHGVTKAQIGLDKLENIKSNYEATRKPNNLDDVLSGYSVGSIWINRVTNVGYVCSDNTELNAIWLEITSLGEITRGLNIGNGVGIYLDKIGSTHRFRTMIPGSNVFFQESANDITIRSRDSHSFLLSPIEIEVISDTYRGILTFPWLRSEFGAYRSGKLIFETVVPVGAMSIRLRNITEKSTLGELSDITDSGFYELAVASPSDNARVRVEVMRTGAPEETDNPRIFGIVLKYET